MIVSVMNVGTFSFYFSYFFLFCFCGFVFVSFRFVCGGKGINAKVVLYLNVLIV